MKNWQRRDDIIGSQPVGYCKVEILTRLKLLSKVIYRYSASIIAIKEMTMRNNNKKVFFFFIYFFLISSCIAVNPSNLQPTKKVVPTPKEIVSTPIIPTPTEGKGVVCGYLLNEETNQPPQATLFLSVNIAAGRDDMPAMMSFSYQTNPRAEINEEGRFCFEEVPPNIYALTLWTPPGNTEFIENEDGQDYLWIEVEPGSVIDLGYLSQ